MFMNFQMFAKGNHSSQKIIHKQKFRSPFKINTTFPSKNKLKLNESFFFVHVTNIRMYKNAQVGET